MPSSCQSDGRRANQTVMRNNAKRSGGLGNAGNGVRHPTNLLVHYNHTQHAEKSRSPWKPAETANSGGRGGESKEARRQGGKETRKQGQAQEGRPRKAAEVLEKSWKSLGNLDGFQSHSWLPRFRPGSFPHSSLAGIQHPMTNHHHSSFHRPTPSSFFILHHSSVVTGRQRHLMRNSPYDPTTVRRCAPPSC